MRTGQSSNQDENGSQIKVLGFIFMVEASGRGENGIDRQGGSRWSGAPKSKKAYFLVVMGS
jgi:hypothetical protein